MAINSRIGFRRTSSSNEDFRKLVVALDKELDNNYDEHQAFYNQYNQIDNLKFVVVAYLDGKGISCGAIKKFDSDSMEVKRMYTLPEYRGMGVASNVLDELERWAVELNYEKCVLETGTKQLKAIALYKNKGYSIIDNYGQYKGIETSICFEKELKLKL